MLLLLLAEGCGRQSGDRPPVILWAWERAEDLRFADPLRRGIAVLVATVWMEGDAVRVEPRRHPAFLRDDMWAIAVVRIESRKPSLSGAQLDAVEREVLRCGTRHKGARGLQVDFDAVASGRAFYRQLLERLRPKVSFLSITALAGWCLFDPWVADLPVDEAVPMLFRMGEEDREVRAHLRNGGDFRIPLCRSSYGVSTDKPLAVPRPKRRRRLYVFHPMAWNADVLATILKQAGYE